MRSTWISVGVACALVAGLSGAGAESLDVSAQKTVGQPVSSAPLPKSDKASKAVKTVLAGASETLALVEPVLFGPPEPSLSEASFEQSAGGTALSAIALATHDADWVKKWEAAGKTLPKIKQARLVALGEKVQVLVFVASRPDAPTIDTAKEPMLYVVDVYRPDGTLQERLPGNTCVKKGERMSGGNLALCEGVLVFELEPSDPKGQWVFKVSLAAPGQNPLVFGTSVEAF